MQDAMVQLIPVFVIGLVFCFIPYKLAPKVGANRLVWVILSIVPILNILFIYYVGYRVVAHLLDRVNSIAEYNERKIG